MILSALAVRGPKELSVDWEEQRLKTVIVGRLLPDYTMEQPRRQSSSELNLAEITNFMVPSRFWEPNNCSDSQEIPDRANKRFTAVPKIHFNIFLPSMPRSSDLSPSFRLSNLHLTTDGAKAWSYPRARGTHVPVQYYTRIKPRLPHR